MDCTIPREKLVEMYMMMLRIRLFEEKVNELFLQALLPGTVHQAQGQEAVAVGVCAALRRDDFIASTHRSHGHSLAKGMTVYRAMAELFGKSTGCCKGKGGSMHLADRAQGILPAIAVVGEGIVVAAGTALAFQYKGTGQVAVSFFGDGAVGTGAFHEGLNMAAVFKLPILFVCENNLYAASTPFHSMSPVEDVAERGAAYGIPSMKADGMDVRTVYAAALEAVNRARGGLGPTLLEFKTYRYGGHSRSDPTKYREHDEVIQWKSLDPITRLKKELITEGVAAETEIGRIEEEMLKSLEQAVHQAQADPIPTIEEAASDVYA